VALGALRDRPGVVSPENTWWADGEDHLRVRMRVSYPTCRCGEPSRTRLYAIHPPVGGRGEAGRRHGTRIGEAGVQLKGHLPP